MVLDFSCHVSLDVGRGLGERKKMIITEPMKAGNVTVIVTDRFCTPLFSALLLRVTLNE